MNNAYYQRNDNSIFLLKHHLVRCPKYRRQVLVGEIGEGLRSLLYQKAEEQDERIEALEILPDHIHLFIESDPSEAPQRLANQFKGFTSLILRSRVPSLWSRSCYFGSICDDSEETARHDLEIQKSS